MVVTLNELDQLKDSRFGQPYPRHGLSLLWWFADECVEIDEDGSMMALCNPDDGDFGFHEFHNAEGLLPATPLTYYEVGNLHMGLHLLPDQVTKCYNSEIDDSNRDRIIVAFDSSQNEFSKIYVTQHLHQLEFNKYRTYRISKGLIKIIQNMERADFLRQVHMRPRRQRHRR